jgi:hypothetical protein
MHGRRAKVAVQYGRDDAPIHKRRTGAMVWFRLPVTHHFSADRKTFNLKSVFVFASTAETYAPLLGLK